MTSGKASRRARRPSGSPASSSGRSHQQKAGEQPGNLVPDGLAVIAVFADIVGAFLAPHFAQVILGFGGLAVAITLAALRKRSRIRVSPLLIRAIGVIGLAIALFGVGGMVVDSQSEKRAALADTCFALRDFLNASANGLTQLAAASGRATESFKRVDANTKDALDRLGSVATRSGSAEAQRLVERLSQQMAAADSYDYTDAGKAQEKVYDARNTRIKLEDLCRKSGHALSPSLDLEIRPTVRDACAAFYQFIELGSSISRKRTPEEIELAEASLRLFAYHAEYVGDNQLMAVEHAIFQSLTKDSQQQRLATGNAVLLCTARGFPRGK